MPIRASEFSSNRLAVASHTKDLAEKSVFEHERFRSHESSQRLILDLTFPHSGRVVPFLLFLRQILATRFCCLTRFIVAEIG